MENGDNYQVNKKEKTSDMEIHLADQNSQNNREGEHHVNVHFGNKDNDSIRKKHLDNGQDQLQQIQPTDIEKHSIVKNEREN